MAGYNSPVSTFVPTDYSAEQLAIERRRKLSDSLLQGAQEPLQTNQTAGGYVIPVSHYAGLAKMLQAGLSMYGTQRADEQEKALAAKYQTDLTNTISRSQAALTGTPAVPDQAPATPNDDNGYANPPVAGSPAVAANPQLAASLLMQHPATQGIGMGQIQAEMARQQTQQRLRDALSLSGAQSAGGTGAAPGGLSGGAPNPMAAMPKEVVALMTSGDPELMKLGQALMSANEGIAQRPGAPVVNKYTGQVIAQPTPSVPAGVQLNIGPNGPTASPVPGAAPAMGGAAAAVTSAQEGAKAPYSMQQMNVPIYLPGGDQINVPLNATDAHIYQTTRRLPADVAASIPGFVQPGDAPHQPSMPGGKPISPEAQTQFASVGLNQIPAAERPMAEAVMRASEQGQPLTLRGPQPAAPTGTGRPVVGRGQSQSEQITQQRQAAGGKAVDEAFAKDYVGFVSGGASDAAKQIAQLQDVVAALGDPNNGLTGAFRGRVPDAVRNVTNPQAVAMRERVEEVVQRSLRAILGAQFTEREGERLISRAYNPSQPQAENAVRVGRLFTQLQQAFQAKQDAAKYYAQNGTLQGWNGKLPSVGDFDLDSAAAAGGGTSAPKVRRWNPQTGKIED